MGTKLILEMYLCGRFCNLGSVTCLGCPPYMNIPTDSSPVFHISMEKSKVDAVHTNMFASGTSHLSHKLASKLHAVTVADSCLTFLSSQLLSLPWWLLLLLQKYHHHCSTKLIPNFHPDRVEFSTVSTLQY